MSRCPPRTTPTDKLAPYTSLLRSQLPARRVLQVEGERDRGVGHVEDLVQQVGRALLRREPLQGEQEGSGEGGGQCRCVLRRVRVHRIVVGGLHRLGQPRADVLDACAVGRTQDVEAVARAHRSKSVVWGKRVSERVDLGGRRIIQKKTPKKNRSRTTM